MTGVHGWLDLPAALIREIERVSQASCPDVHGDRRRRPRRGDRRLHERTRHADLRRGRARGQSSAAADSRIESRVVEALPPSVPTPRRRLVVDGDGWVLLGFEAVTGRTPHEPWRDPDLEGALDALARWLLDPRSSPAGVVTQQRPPEKTGELAPSHDALAPTEMELTGTPYGP